MNSTDEGSALTESRRGDKSWMDGTCMIVESFQWVTDGIVGAEMMWAICKVTLLLIYLTSLEYLHVSHTRLTTLQMDHLMSSL